MPVRTVDPVRPVHGVVIVDERPGGPDAARRLAGTFHTLFQPLPCQAATAALPTTSIADPIRSALRRASDVSARMGDAGHRVLSGFPDRLRALGVALRPGAPVRMVHAAAVVAGGERIAAEWVFRTAGTAATPVARWPGMDGDRRGLVAARPDCSPADDPPVFVTGDAARLDGPDGTPLPGLGSVAGQQGRPVAGVVPAARAGRLAWAVWNAVHLMLLASTRNRVLVSLNGVRAWLTRSRGARIITRMPNTP